jgi:hypothetical protein
MRKKTSTTLASVNTDQDEKAFAFITSDQLTDLQKQAILDPPASYPKEDIVLAIHWHPETVPMELIRQRIDATFPNRNMELIIPTQHNQLMSYDGFYGVEVDCFSKSFNRKVQLLLHFSERNLSKAHRLKEMLSHTFLYRSNQLFEIFDTILLPDFESRLVEAARNSGADKRIVNFTKDYTLRLKQLIERHHRTIRPDFLKNKLLRNFIDMYRHEHTDRFIDRVQVFVKAVKKVVKRHFNFEYFYRTEEIIEEARHVGAGIVVPHPEQFWPVLLADYDIDGYEVWNPQSREYSEFLISVVANKNREQKHKNKSLLILMGDDCHLGEKIKEKRMQDTDKAKREVGVQPLWDDPKILKALSKAGFNKKKVIEVYRDRLL